jgi:molecular chaperone DnaJ
VSIDTPLEQIHQRFKHLSKKFHPDLNKEAFIEEKYKKINNAYQIIRDYLETFSK